MPALLARMPQHHDQHDQQADHGDAERPEHYCSQKDSGGPDRPAVKEANYLQLHRSETRTRCTHSECVPDQHKPADHDDRSDDAQCQTERTRRARQQEDQRKADDDRYREVDEIRHETFAERTYLHPRGQACLAIRATLRGRFHEQLLVFRNCFAGETLLRKVNQYRYSITELHDSAQLHDDRLSRGELLTIDGSRAYQDRSVRGVQVGNNNLPIIRRHLEVRPADVVVRARDSHQPG